MFLVHIGERTFSALKNLCMIYLRKAKRDIIKKGELPRLKCFHNGIILIVICFHYQSKTFIITFPNRKLIAYENNSWS